MIGSNFQVDGEYLGKVKSVSAQILSGQLHILVPQEAGEEKEEALEKITQHFLPGRSPELRKSTDNELKATTVIALALAEYSVKVSDGEPDDLPEDLASPIWAGIVPMRMREILDRFCAGNGRKGDIEKLEAADMSP